jgi:hypothetical protein
MKIIQIRNENTTQFVRGVMGQHVHFTESKEHAATYPKAWNNLCNEDLQLVQSKMQKNWSVTIQEI